MPSKFSYSYRIGEPDYNYATPEDFYFEIEIKKIDKAPDVKVPIKHPQLAAQVNTFFLKNEEGSFPKENKIDTIEIQGCYPVLPGLPILFCEKIKVNQTYIDKLLPLPHIEEGEIKCNMDLNPYAIVWTGTFNSFLIHMNPSSIDVLYCAFSEFLDMSAYNAYQHLGGLVEEDSINPNSFVFQMQSKYGEYLQKDYFAQKCRFENIQTLHDFLESLNYIRTVILEISPDGGGNKILSSLENTKLEMSEFIHQQIE